MKGNQFNEKERMSSKALDWSFADLELLGHNPKQLSSSGIVMAAEHGLRSTEEEESSQSAVKVRKCLSLYLGAVLPLPGTAKLREEPLVKILNQLPT